MRHAASKNYGAGICGLGRQARKDGPPGQASGGPFSCPYSHRACARLLVKAAEVVQPPVVEITEAELQAMVDELYA